MPTTDDIIILKKEYEPVDDRGVCRARAFFTFKGKRATMLFDISEKIINEPGINVIVKEHCLEWAIENERLS